MTRPKEEENKLTTKGAESLLGLFSTVTTIYMFPKQLLRTLLREVEYSVCSLLTLHRKLRYGVKANSRKERGRRRGSISVPFRDMLRCLDKGITTAVYVDVLHQKSYGCDASRSIWVCFLFSV